MPGPIKLHSKATTVFKRVMDDKYQSDRGVGALSAFALAASEENGRGHLVITAPTSGSAGVMPAVVYGLLEVRKVDRQKIRDGMLAAAAIDYLCKHHATLSAAEGGCQAEIGVASSMAAALAATALRDRPQRDRVEAPCRFDETVLALAQTAKEMNSKYKETSEAGALILRGAPRWNLAWQVLRGPPLLLAMARQGLRSH